MKYGLEIYAPVGPGGHFLDSVELFGGQRVFDANPKIEEALKARGRLWHREAFSHQYPHCWRCHNPVIFLATSQWFIRLDGELRAGGQKAESKGQTLRQTALTAIDRDVKWNSPRGATTGCTNDSRTVPMVHLAQRGVGRPDPGARLRKCGDSNRDDGDRRAGGARLRTVRRRLMYERPRRNSSRTA